MRIRTVLSTTGAPVVSLAGVIGLWWLATIVTGVSSLFLPSPVEVVHTMASMRGYLAGETLQTLVETVTGFGLAVATGFGLAILLAMSRTVERLVMPALVVLNAVPKVAIAPLLVLWLGFDLAPKTALVWSISVFPIVLAAVAGLRATPVEYGELAASLLASRWQTMRYIRLPWALPQIMVGLKVSIQLAVVGAVVAEVTSPTRGLGAVIVASAASADTALAFAAVVLLAAMSGLLFGLVVLVDRWALPWTKGTVVG